MTTAGNAIVRLATALSSLDVRTPDKAFDGDPSTYWHSAGEMPTWLKAKVSQIVPVVSCSLTFMSGVGIARAPKDFLIQGSTDDNVWVTLSTQVGLAWTSGETKVFTFAVGSYLYYRIYVTASNGDNYQNLAEVVYGYSFIGTTDAFGASQHTLLPGAADTADSSVFTTEAGEPLILPVAKTGWSWFVPIVTGSYQFDTIGSTFDTGLALYTGSSISALTLIASDDNSGGGTTSKIVANLVAGVRYSIQSGAGVAAITLGGTLVLLVTLLSSAAVMPPQQPLASVEAAGVGWLYKGRSTRTADTGAGA